MPTWYMHEQCSHNYYSVHSQHFPTVATTVLDNALLGEGTGSIFDISCTNYSLSLLNCSITDSLSCSVHTDDVSICCSFGE